MLWDARESSSVLSGTPLTVWFPCMCGAWLGLFENGGLGCFVTTRLSNMTQERYRESGWILFRNILRRVADHLGSPFVHHQMTLTSGTGGLDSSLGLGCYGGREANRGEVNG